MLVVLISTIQRLQSADYSITSSHREFTFLQRHFDDDEARQLKFTIRSDCERKKIENLRSDFYGLFYAT